MADPTSGSIVGTTRPVRFKTLPEASASTIDRIREQNTKLPWEKTGPDDGGASDSPSAAGHYLTDAGGRAHDSGLGGEIIAEKVAAIVAAKLVDQLGALLEPLNQIVKLLGEWYGFDKKKTHALELVDFMARLDHEQMMVELKAAQRRAQARGLRPGSGGPFFDATLKDKS
jgi:hypothetical protein